MLKKITKNQLWPQMLYTVQKEEDHKSALWNCNLNIALLKLE